MGIIPYERLYRLPFSKNDNFNGWLEITELCNMSCPGCYRGCDRPEHQGGNKPLRELKAEVLELRRLRNCSMISIAGGEPLVHPDLTELVRFIASQRMKPVILTNGKLLTDDKLLELSRAGLVGVMIRVDSLQEPSSGLTENDLFEKREKFAALCARAGIYLTLTICTDKSNLPFVPDVLQWAEKNASRVGQVLIILKRALMFTREDVIDESGFVYPEELYSLLAEKIPGFAFSAYLGSEGHSLQAKWLQGYQYVLRGKSLGCGDKKLPELIQACYHYLTGSYLSLLERKKLSLSFPLYCCSGC